jgi:hypothetical protein
MKPGAAVMIGFNLVEEHLERNPTTLVRGTCVDCQSPIQLQRDHLEVRGQLEPQHRIPMPTVCINCAGIRLRVLGGGHLAVFGQTRAVETHRQMGLVKPERE